MQSIKSLITLIFLTSLTALASSNPVLQSGINAYQQGKYDEAKQQFTSLAAEPSWRFAALYNLGNTAVRQKHLGEALGYYTRARALNPHDRDTQDNLKFVLSSLGGRRLTQTPSNFDLFKTEVLDRFTFGEALGATCVVSLFFLSLTLGFVKKRRAEEGAFPSTGLISSFILLVFLSSLSTCKLIDSTIDRGTVILDRVDLRSGPNETNASMQEVAEGTELRIFDTDNNWLQVSANGGLLGWVPKASLMITSGGGPF